MEHLPIEPHFRTHQRTGKNSLGRQSIPVVRNRRLVRFSATVFFASVAQVQPLGTQVRYTIQGGSHGKGRWRCRTNWLCLV
jgi:hypothetical protein